MYTLSETPSLFSHFEALQKTLAKKLLSPLPVEERSVIIPAETDLLKEARIHSNIYSLVEGHLAFKVEDKKLYFLEEGDIVGLPQICEGSNCVLSSDFAVKVDIYRYADLNKARSEKISYQDQVDEFLAVQREILLLLQSGNSSETVLNPQVSNYSAGAVIIEQGSTSKEVYTLVEGSAEAYVEGVKVGDIKQGEIFGMFAAVSGSARSASVVAASACLVAAVSSEQYVELIKHQPQAVLKTIEDMARMIVGLNKKVVSA